MKNEKQLVYKHEIEFCVNINMEFQGVCLQEKLL